MFLLAATVAVVAAQEAENAKALQVMTYNVRYASDQGPNAWGERLPVALEMLAAESPDV